MCLEEFDDMIQTSGVVDETFGAREIAPMFNLSMITQKDEIESDRHMNMQMTEFIESIGRVADKLALPPAYDDVRKLNNTYQDDFEESATKDEKQRVWKSRPLYLKIESLLYVLMTNCLPKSTSIELIR